MTMLIREAYLLLQRFCTQAINNVQVTISEANQFAARPKKPCVLIEIANCKDVGAFNQFVDEDGLKTYTILKTIDVTFTAYSDKDLSAEDMLCTIYNMFFTELTFNVFGRNLALLKKLTDIKCVSIEVASKIEDRAFMELRFNITQTARFNTGLIEHVEVHDQINNEVYTIDI